MRNTRSSSLKVRPKAYIRKWGINTSAEDSYYSEELFSRNICGDPRNSNACYKNKSILFDCSKSFNMRQCKNYIKRSIPCQTSSRSEKYIRYIIKGIKRDLILIVEKVNS